MPPRQLARAHKLLDSLFFVARYPTPEVLSIIMPLICYCNNQSMPPYHTVRALTKRCLTTLPAVPRTSALLARSTQWNE